MSFRLSASDATTRVTKLLFGAPMDDDNRIVVTTLRELMAVESVLSSHPQWFVVAPQPETVKAKEQALAKKFAELSKISDENLALLSTLLGNFSNEERAKIINDVSSYGMTDYQTRRYLLLLESVTDLGNASGVFADPTFFELVRGLKYGIEAADDSDLLGTREKDMEWSDTRDLFSEQLRCRFGLRLHIIAKTTYSEPLTHLFRDNVKMNGLVLRDPSLESLLLNRPDRMEDIYDMLMINYTTTGNKIGGILLAEDRVKNAAGELTPERFNEQQN